MRLLPTLLACLALVALHGCAAEPDPTPVANWDVIKGYTGFVSGQCEMNGRTFDLSDTEFFVEHLSPNGLIVRSYLGCEVGGFDVTSTPDSLSLPIGNEWDEPGCWLILGATDAPEPFEMRARSATGTLVYDEATDSVQLDVVYTGMNFGEPRTMTCSHYAETRL